MSFSYEPQFEPQTEDSAAYARSVLGGVDMAARSTVVNRTHRVVRQRATVMKARRSYMRSLMLPMMICGILLALVGFAVWTGLYQYEATGTVQDVASLASFDTTNQLLVAMLWFVPLTLVLLVAVWVRHVRSHESEPTR